MKLAAAAVLTAVLSCLAGAAATLWLLDRLFGGDGPRIEIRLEHRNLLDHEGWPDA